MSDTNDMNQTNDQAGTPGAVADSGAEGRQLVVTKIVTTLVWGAVAIVALFLVARLAAPEAIPSLGGGPKIGVVDIQGVIQEYQQEALNAARQGTEQEQAEALEKTGFMVSRIERAVEVLASRHEGVVLIQKQAVVSDAGLTDYTPELRRIIDPTMPGQSGAGQ